MVTFLLMLTPTSATTLFLGSKNRWEDEGNVISIEPMPTTFKVLTYNVYKLNAIKNAKLIQKVHSVKRGSIQFSLPTGIMKLLPPFKTVKIY